MRNRGGILFEALRYIGLSVMMAVSLYGFFFMIMNSFKTEAQMTINYWLPEWKNPAWENYEFGWKAVSPYIWNSIYIGLLTVAGTLLVGVISAYIFARFRFRGKETLYIAVISLMMIPGILTFIPSFIIVQKLGLLNSPLALIIPGIAGGQVMAVFLLRSFFEQISRELLEAARVDGATEGGILLRIVLPLAIPMVMTISILTLLGSWNSYIWPLVTISDQAYWTLPLGIANISSGYDVKRTQMYAAYTVASLPLMAVFLFTMRYFIEGLSSGSVKG